MPFPARHDASKPAHLSLPTFPTSATSRAGHGSLLWPLQHADRRGRAPPAAALWLCGYYQQPTARGTYGSRGLRFAGV